MIEFHVMLACSSGAHSGIISNWGLELWGQHMEIQERGARIVARHDFERNADESNRTTRTIVI